MHGIIVKQMLNYTPSALDLIFGALSDPTRRRMLEHLARGEQRVTDLAKPHAMSLPAISQHVRVLEKAGLIRRRRLGRVHHLKLKPERLKQAETWIEENRRGWEERLDRLEEYVKKLQAEEKHEKNR
jgi:DNA-binding transcriptional ArsR family regulator